MLFLLYRDGKRNILPHTPCSFHCKHCASGIVCEIAALVLLQLPAPAKRKG